MKNIRASAITAVNFGIISGFNRIVETNLSQCTIFSKAHKVLNPCEEKLTISAFIEEKSKINAVSSLLLIFPPSDSTNVYAQLCESNYG